MALAAAAGVLLSGAQFRFFDCNEVPLVSFVGGVLTIVLLYVAGAALHGVITSPEPNVTRLRNAAGVVFVGGWVVGGVAFFTLVSHMCG